MNSGLISTSLVLAGVCMWTLDPSAALSFSPESHVTAPSRANFAVGRYAVPLSGLLLRVRQVSGISVDGFIRCDIPFIFVI